MPERGEFAVLAIIGALIFAGLAYWVGVSILEAELSLITTLLTALVVGGFGALAIMAPRRTSFEEKEK